MTKDFTKLLYQESVVLVVEMVYSQHLVPELRFYLAHLRRGSGGLGIPPVELHNKH